MKSKSLKIFGAFVIVLIAIFMVLNFTIDGIVKSSIEESGTELFQTEVDVRNVNISLFDGSGEIYGLSVANPEDFSDEPAIEMQEIRIKVNLMSLFSDTILVDNVHITGASLFFEQQGFGINLRQLNQNMDLTSDEEEPAMIIDHLLVDGATVRVSSTIDRERTAEATLENFELNGIGQQGSNTMKQSMQQVMEPIIERAIQEAVSRGLLEQLENKIQDLLGGDDE
jgi:hypothetical protein